LIGRELYENLMPALEVGEDDSTIEDWDEIEKAWNESEVPSVEVQEPKEMVENMVDGVTDDGKGEGSADMEDATPATTEKSVHSAVVAMENAERSTCSIGRHSFGWCPCCLEMRAGIFDNDGESLKRLHSIIVVYCGGCTREKTDDEDDKKLKKKTLRKKQAQGSREYRTTEWKGMNISPQAWRGSEAWNIAKAVVGREVEFLSDGIDGTAYVEAEDFWRGLGKVDRIVSIDVEGYRAGQRRDLVLPYVRGGFM